MSPALQSRLPSLATKAAPAFVLAALLVAWELLVRVMDVQELILPPPSRIGAQVWELRSTLIEHALFTVSNALIGFLIGVAAGLALAVLMSLLPRLRGLIYPLVIGIQTTPKIAIAPLLVLWFGVGRLPKILVVALLCFFPIMINTLAALDGTDRRQLALAKSVNANWMQTYRYIRIPGAIPQFFAGMKLGLVVCFIGSIVAEWVTSSEGLGYLMLIYNASFRTADMFAVLAVLVLLSVASFAALAGLQRRFSWETRLADSSTAGYVTKRVEDPIA